MAQDDQCPSPDSQYRLDCGDDDYFAPETPERILAGPQSVRQRRQFRFLAKVKPRPLPVQPAAPTGVTRDFDSVDWQAVPGVRYDVGVVEGDTSITWVVQDTTAGTVAMAPISARSRVSCVQSMTPGTRSGFAQITSDIRCVAAPAGTGRGLP